MVKGVAWYSTVTTAPCTIVVVLIGTEMGILVAGIFLGPEAPVAVMFNVAFVAASDTKLAVASWAVLISDPGMVNTICGWTTKSVPGAAWPARC